MILQLIFQLIDQSANHFKSGLFPSCIAQDIYHLSNLLSLSLFNVSEACLVKLTLTTARILNIYFTSSWEQFFTLQELHPLQAVPASLMNFFDNLVMFHIFPVSFLFLSSSVL